MSIVKPISTLPVFVTPEERREVTSSTPLSFDSIPPTLRHKEDNVSISFEPPLEEWQGARGTLYIIESVLVFMSENGKGFEVKYPDIVLHAISRSGTAPCIYCQLQIDSADEEQSSDMSIFPVDGAALTPIFDAIAVCTALHPTPDADDALLAFEPFTGEEELELSEDGRTALEHLENIIEDPQGLLGDGDDDDVRVNGRHE